MSYNVNYTYVKFNVLDYTNSSTLSTYTLENTPLKFIPDFSLSPLLSATNTISNKSIRWDFGDGNFSTELTPTHRYEWPGEYTVGLTVYDNAGNAYDSSYTSTVQVYDYITSYLRFEEYKTLIYDVPAGRFLGPITINVGNSWQNFSALSAHGCTITLYASGARGGYNYIKQSSKDKWSHLRALSRFYKQETIAGVTSYTEIENITANQTEFYVKRVGNSLQPCSKDDSGSIFAGTTGSCQFWYTDDVPVNYTTANSPIIIFASIDSAKFNDAFTSRINAFDHVDYPPYGYQNLNPAVFPYIKTRYNPAAYLSITTTGIDGEGTLSSTKFDIPEISWQETEIPYLIKFKDQEGYTTKNYPPLSSSSVINFTYPSLTSYDVQTSVLQLQDDGTYIALTGVKFYEDFTIEAPQSLGAFYKGYFISSQSSHNCILTAGVNVIEPAFFPKDAFLGWIAIPQYKSLFRILRQEYYSGIDGSKLVTFNSNNNTLFNINDRNSYAITVAPSGDRVNEDYQTWVADTYNDRISRLDPYGNLTPIYYTQDEYGQSQPSYYYTLSGVPTRINNQIIFVDYRNNSEETPSRATPGNISLDSSNDIWISLADSGSAIKIDTFNGYVINVAHPGDFDSTVIPTSIDTDYNDDVWITYSDLEFNKLIKYKGKNNLDLNANLLLEYQFPDSITPDEICIDRNGYAWVTAYNHTKDRSSFNTANDLLYKFDINGTIVAGYPLSGFKLIGNLTIDGNQNAWVSHDKETLTRIDGLTQQRSDFIGGYGNNKTNYICSIGGITCDTANNIWVINNFDRKLFLLDASIATPPIYLLYNYSVDLTYPYDNMQTVVTFTRDSSATYYNSTGVIETADIYEPRFYYDNFRTNYLLYSNDATSIPWNATSGVSVASNATQAPDNSNTASSVTTTTVEGNYIWNSTTASTSGCTYAFSTWMKLGAYTLSGTDNFSLILKDSEGNIPDNGSTNITVTTVWQRFYTTATFPTTAASDVSCFIVANSGTLGQPGDTYYVWGAQLEFGDTPTSLIPTTSSIRTVSEYKGLLAEEASTNYVDFSTYAPTNNTGTEDRWVSVYPDYGALTPVIAAPDNTTTAVQLSCNSNGISQLTVEVPPFTPEGNNDFTISFYARLVSRTTGDLICDLNDDTPSINYTSLLSAGQWTRVVVTDMPTSDTRTFVNLKAPSETDAIVDYWGLQIEQGSTATSYIPTSGAVYTREKDIATITDTVYQDFAEYVQQRSLTFSPSVTSYTFEPPTSAGQYSDGFNEFRAIGDWNGYRWINKYAVPYSTVRTITGASNIFNILPYTGENNISKINENWDASSYYNSLRYQESLLDKEVFFEQFLGTIVGGVSAQPYELGKTIYEKVANFVSNKSDIDKSNIDTLISFCNELSVAYQDFNYQFPPQLKRLVDLLSIKQSNLWGTQNKYTENFNNRGTIFSNDQFGINLGAKIDVLTGVITPGVPIVAQEIFSGLYKIVNTSFFSESTDSTPLSTYSDSWGWSLTAPPSISGVDIGTYYSFFEYNPKTQNTFYDNIIDWANPMTTLSPQNSSYANWSKDNGVIQSLLSYELSKGLKLFTSAADITYNS